MTFPTNYDLVPEPRPAVSKAVEESVKLTGTFVNNFAVGIAVTGGIAPVFAYLNGSIAAEIAFWQVSLASSVCILAAVGLHFAARRYVRQELS